MNSKMTERYDTTLNPDNPVLSGFASGEDEQAGRQVFMRNSPERAERRLQCCLFQRTGHGRHKRGSSGVTLIRTLYNLMINVHEKAGFFYPRL
ncbi:hypothetical protein [Desulfonema magnum]|uniref:Uncharacterized protein n=1 Tax=Desulfonema magnum TaxID=45655 RepID=A0A975BSC9_9BACT|nr:hypothetical protein [Desulfonema magnum]QTA90710.1 Uncharacterized protein dnm_067710 [Desulfonema magnum]